MFDRRIDNYFASESVPDFVPWLLGGFRNMLTHTGYTYLYSWIDIQLALFAGIHTSLHVCEKVFKLFFK